MSPTTTDNGTYAFTGAANTTLTLVFDSDK